MKKITIELFVVSGLAAGAMVLAPPASAVAPAGGSAGQIGNVPLSSRCTVIDTIAPGGSHPIGRLPDQWVLRPAASVDATC
jgi:hypothetical protein